MTQPPMLLCIGLTTVDVVALPVRMEPFDGVRLIDAMQMAPAGTAAGAALVAAKLQVATQLAGAVGADAAGGVLSRGPPHPRGGGAPLPVAPGPAPPPAPRALPRAGGAPHFPPHPT